MTDTINTPTIQTLTDQLTQTLQSTQSADTLARQTQLLDQLFTTLMTTQIARRLDDTNNRYIREVTMDWLAMTLKIQKQCMDTGKAAAAVEYMKNLNTINTLPPPLKIEKRNE